MANYNSIFKTPDFTIIAPIHNGADRILRFLERLEDCLKDLPATFAVLIVNDASVDGTASHLRNFQFSSVNAQLRSIHLPFYCGLHESISHGLTVARQLNCQRFIVMKANGEDDPGAIADLIKIRDKDAVLVDPGPRAENLIFWLVYRMYQFIFRLFTSRELVCGIYSMLSRGTVIQLTQHSFLHYTARLYKMKLRGKKIRFESKKKSTIFQYEMKQLFQDSVRSYMEFGEELLTAFLKLSLFFGFMVFAGVVAILYSFIFTEDSVPSWLLITTVGLLCAVILSMGVFGIGVSVLHKVRSRSGFIVPQASEASQAQSDPGPSPRKARMPLK